MPLRSKLITALLIQPIGVGSLFLTVWYLGNFVSIETQGYFSALKSQIDLLTVLLAFGFPQTVIYQINNAGVSRRVLVLAAFPYAAMAGVILIVACSDWLPGLKHLWSQSLWATPTVIATVGVLVFHRLVRGIFVTIHDGWRFSVITIAPMVILMVLAVSTSEVTHEHLQRAYLYSAIASVLIMLWLMRNGCSPGNSPDWGALWSTGLPIFLQGLAMALQPVIAFLWIKQNAEGLTGAAHFSLGLYAYSAGILPITMVAPILFNRWSSNKPHAVLKGLKRVVTLAVVLIPVMILMGVIVKPVLMWVFDSSYQQATVSIRLMLLAIPFAFITLFSMPAFMAMGKFQINASLAFFRLLVMIAVFFCTNKLGLTQHASTPELVAISWLTAEVMVAGVVFWLMNKYDKQSIKAA